MFNARSYSIKHAFIIYAMYDIFFIKFFEDVFFTSNGKMIKDIGTISSIL